jgi:hypothetical protein
MDATITGTTLHIVNPVAEAESELKDAERHPPARRPVTLAGKRIGLFWNGKNNGDVALRMAQELLSQRFDGLTFHFVVGENGGITRYLSAHQVKQLQQDVDVVIATTADCGSCTSWLIRDMCTLERAGIPTVGYTAAIFDEDAHFSCKVFGVPEACPVVVPQTFTNRTRDELQKLVADSLDAVIAGLTVDRPVMPELPSFDHVVLHEAAELAYDGADQFGAWDNMTEDFIRRGWSDGMPLVPPTPERVEALVAATGRPGDELVGKFAPGFGLGTVRKIAANAAMAGCKPEYMPVIMALMDCVLDPSIGLRTWAMSTGPQAPVIMVSGPIAREIGMNSGVCALGPGSISRVNVAIGRALRLIMMNVGHSYPGVSDMDTIGSAMKFSACVAENEARNPWQPYRVEQGFGLEDSTVTVNVPYGQCELFDFQNSDPERLIENFATVTSNACGAPNPGIWLIKKAGPRDSGYPFNGLFQNLIMMCPEHAAVFADAGWSVQDIKQALYRKSRLSFRKLMLNQPEDLFRALHPNMTWLFDVPDTEIPVYPGPDNFDIFVVGADAGRSLYFFGGTHSVTKPVRRP